MCSHGGCVTQGGTNQKAQKVRFNFTSKEGKPYTALCHSLVKLTQRGLSSLLSVIQELSFEKHSKVVLMDTKQPVTTEDHELELGYSCVKL